MQKASLAQKQNSSGGAAYLPSSGAVLFLILFAKTGHPSGTQLKLDILSLAYQKMEEK